jgi:hypothetical protein
MYCKPGVTTLRMQIEEETHPRRVVRTAGGPKDELVALGRVGVDEVVESEAGGALDARERRGDAVDLQRGMSVSALH